MANNRRRTYIVRMEFQKDFIIKYCVLVFIAVIFLSLIVYFSCGTTVTTVFKDSRLRIMSTNDFILPYLLWSTLIAVVCAVGVCWRMTMIISNRLAGPLYRFEKDIAQVGQGDLTKKIRVREKDEFKTLAKILNDLVSDWRGDVVELKNKLAALGQSANLGAEEKRILNEIKEDLGKYKV